MRCHVAFPLAVSLTFGAAALSTGNPIFLMLTVLILLTLLVGLISVLCVSASLSISSDSPEESVYHGDDLTLSLRIRHRGIIPVAPITLLISSGSFSPGHEIRLRDVPGKLQRLSYSFHASHIGTFSVGVNRIMIEDLLGYFQISKSIDSVLFSVQVLPVSFDTEPLLMSPGDPGSEIMARATEDLSAPSDIRAYQAGDAMKKIHWKLSLRKGELMVRKFDEPILQDVLIMMDCSRPPSWGHSEAEADIRDAILETAASVYKSECKTDHNIRMPLYGTHPIDIENGMGYPLVLDNLSRVDFSASDRFERILMMESGRLRKVGCVVVITARLNSAMVDIMSRIHRIGPNMRLYLVTFAPDDSNVLPLISRLRQSGIDVCYVTPGQG